MDNYETITIISGIISIIVLVVFFVMAVALGNISKNLKRVTQILEDFAADKGYTLVYTCPECKRSFEGELDKCPHCKMELTWDNEK